MQDPADWLPELIKRAWDQAVDTLRADGEDITTHRGEIWPASDRRSGGDLRGLVRLKVYESGDEVHTRVTHGDLDKDIEWTWTIDIQAKDGGDQARKKVHDTVQVIVRALELYRMNPHPDWNEVDQITASTVNNYADFQQRVVTCTLHRYGKILVRETPPSYE